MKWQVSLRYLPSSLRGAHSNFVFLELSMANRSRRSYRSEEEMWKSLYGDDGGSELDSGSSADEEAELEHQLQIFGDESR